MKKIAMALCAALILTVALDGQESQQIQVEELTKTTASWDGRPLPSYPQGQPEITVARVTIPAGQKLKWHKHPVFAAGVVLEGQLTVVTDQDERLHLQEGESIVEVFEKWHHGINEGDEPTVLVVFYAGIEGTPISVLREDQ